MKPAVTCTALGEGKARKDLSCSTATVSTNGKKLPSACDANRNCQENDSLLPNGRTGRWIDEPAYLTALGTGDRFSGLELPLDVSGCSSRCGQGIGPASP
ncbi:hypothetical protein Smic_78310 [Streptomyces microflavus]|uniref:Uncharacterized protein n=1 Tax=Streptomyces microflavus TaxID=1919 RepID=A0A7J0D5L5_STRMI|nr:hypothetical protein Smic_78310 [Streptomyces microflavus]